MTRRRYHFGLLVLVCLGLIGSAAYAATWVPLNGIQAQEAIPDVRVQRSDYTSIQLQMDLSGFYYETVSAQGNQFTSLGLEGEGYTTEIGAPALPVIRRLIEIPYGAEASLVVGPMTLRQATLAEFGLQRIMPVQPPVEKLPGAKEAAPFALDPSAYSQAGFRLTDFARLSEPANLRGHRFVQVEIFPINYSPADGRLQIVSEMEIQIRLTGSDLGLTRQMKARYEDRYVQDLAARLFLNSGAYDDPDLIPTPLGLLIITSPQMAVLPIMQEFVDWKSQKGFHVTVATTAQTGTTNTQIKAYIQNAYDTWPIPPNFVLIIGDVNVVPHWVGSGADNPGTDLYYATLEGSDYFNDVGIGRLSPSTDANLANMINKTLDYEQVGWTVPDEWEKAAVFMASNDNYTISEGTHNYVISNYLDPDGYRSYKLYCHTYSATTAQVTQNINAGRSLAIYSGHGSVTSWADGPVFTQSNVQALTNVVYPFVCSHACLTGQFQSSECFGETWIRIPNGTFAFWGSSVTSYWDEDDILEKGMFEGFFDEQSPQQDQNLTWISGMTDYGKYYLWSHYGGGGQSMRYWEMYNILGDPTVDLWTDVPQNLTVNFPSALLIGQNSLQVTVSGYPDWAMVNASSDAEPLQFTDYVNNGTVTFNLGAGFTVPGTLNIWVTGHDCHPYHGTAQIIPPSGPYVVFDSLVVNDSPMGNGNGQLDYHETSELTIYAKNVGVATANNVTLNISTQDSLLTIIDGSEFLGTLAPGAVANTNRGFTVQASSQLPDEHALACQLTAVSGSSNWNSSFSILGHAPVVEFDSLVVHDDTGNQNGCLDPGETASLEIFLRNNGSAPVGDVEFLATCSDPYITGITVMPEWVGALEPGQAASGAINVSVSSACPQEHTVTFNLGIAGSEFYTNTDQFSTVVGNPLYLPVGPDAYGYLAYDNFDGNEAPVFNWIEIVSAGGTAINYTADDQTAVLDLPFTFRYYGQDYTQLSVCSNGWLAMGETTSVDWSNSGIPNSDGPPNMIAPFWEDLSPQLQGTVAYAYNAANHYFIVEFSGVRQYTPASAIETFEVVLYDPAYYPTATGDGKILFQYNQVSDPSSSTTGIENSTQTIGLQYLYDNTYDVHAKPLTAGTAILFQTANLAGGVDITLTPISPPIQIPANGGSFQYNVSVANTGTTPSTFDAWIMVQLPSSSWYGPVLGPINLTLPASATLTRQRTQNVPGSAPAGSYIYRGYVGSYSSVRWDSSSFNFTKLTTTGDGPVIGDWTNSGEGFEAWMAQTPAVLPNAFSLEQNYPNPFNPLTAIRYQIPDARNVSLRVYDTAGRLVANLVNGWQEAGEYHATFDASSLASGIYLYRLEAGDFTATKKMVLIK